MLVLRKHIVFILLMCLWIGVAFGTYKDYGITADEEKNYLNGKRWISYYTSGTNLQTIKDQIALQGDSPLFDTHNRTYSALLTLLNTFDYYEWFHLQNMLLAVILFVLIYIFIFCETNNSLYSVLTVLMLMLTPRILGHIPANPKDIPFAIIYYLALSMIVLLAKKENLMKLLILGIVFGLSHSLRFIGVTLYIIYIFTEILNKRTVINIVLNLIIIGTIGIFVNMILFPHLGANFFYGLSDMISASKSFEAWDGRIIYFGQVLSKHERPGSYLFVWIFITTPVYILIGWIYSIKFIKNSTISILNFALLLNLGLYLMFHPVIYNGLRHFLYLVPIIVTVSLLAFYKLLAVPISSKKAFLARLLLIGLIGINLVKITYDIATLYPYQYVYFNELIGGLKGAKDKFDLEYWGASYKEAAAWLRAQPFSNVYSCNVSSAVWYYAQGNYQMVDSSDKADYIVCDYDNLQLSNFNAEEIFYVDRSGVKIISVLKTRVIY